jgi:hypothetical protein
MKVPVVEKKYRSNRRKREVIQERVHRRYEVPEENINPRPLKSSFFIGLRVQVLASDGNLRSRVVTGTLSGTVAGNKNCIDARIE